MKLKLKNLSTIKIILVTMFVSLLAYVVAVLILTLKDKTVPDSLTYGLFGSFTGEGIVSGLLRSKDQNKDKEKQLKICIKYGIKMPTFAELFNNNCQQSEDISSATPVMPAEADITDAQIQNMEGG